MWKDAQPLYSCQLVRAAGHPVLPYRYALGPQVVVPPVAVPAYTYAIASASVVELDLVGSFALT